MKVFAAVARLGSFAAAAEELDISNTMCSKFVRDLEKNLDARLINRTTRQLSLTEVGSTYHKKVIDILTEVEEAEQCVSELQNEPVGTLRIMSLPSFGSFHIARAIKGYKQQYPKVAIELNLSDDFDNLVDRGMDLAFRVGELEDSSVIALKISSSRLIVCASPEYLKENGTPQTPEALKDHVCLVTSNNVIFTPHWTFNIDGVKTEFDIKSDYLTSNIADSLRVAAINGSGLIQLPSYMIGLDIQSGRLMPVLEKFEPKPLPINLVYAHRKHMSVKIRSFVDYMQGYFETPPYWDKWMFEGK
ncbi:MAG: DNA-binding transcriptional LysR family regulator [Gammaproteobacteria bacterium]|jgi:DNA-binding transcriptional LysR family regulator